MRVWKLVSGILSIVISTFVCFQSAAAGLSNALEENGEVSGSAGVIVAVLMLAAGITSIVVRNKNGKGGNIALVVMFGIAAIFGYTMAGSFSDLKIWASWCVLCAVLAVVSMLRNGKASGAGAAPAGK